MKKLNIPLVLVLVVGSLATVIGVYFLHEHQESRSADRVLERSEKAAAAGNVDDQLQLLRRYLRHRPDDLENLKKLLEISRQRLFTAENVSYLQVGMLLASLEKAIRDHPEDVELRRQGYIFSAGIGRYGDALDHLAQLKTMPDQMTAEDRLAMARCLWRNGESRDAMTELGELTGFDLSSKTFDDAKAVAPAEIDAYALLALIYIRDVSKDNDLTVPTMIVDKAVERNPESVNAYLRRASFYQENMPGKEGKEKSLADIRKALELSPDDQTVILAAASTAMAVGDVSWARQLVDDGLVKHPESPEMFAKRAEVARAENQVEQALDFIRQGLEKNQMNRELMYRRASYQIDLGRLSDAQTTIERLGSGFDPFRVDVLRARILMAENNYVEAAKKLERMRPMVSVDSRARPLINEYLVECYRRLNQPDRIASLGLNMDNAQARFNQADAYVRQGKPKDAVTIYEDLLKNEDSLTPEGREAVFSRLLSTLVQIERAKPVAERDWRQVDRMAEEKVRRSNLRDAAAVQFEIEMLVSKDQLSEARKKAEQAVARYPRHASFRLLLAQLTNDPVQALRILDQLEQAVGDSVVLRLTRADQIAKTGGTDVADRIRALEQNTESLSDDDRNNLSQGLAGVYQRIGLPQEAIRIWRQVLARNEKNLGIRVAIFDLAFEANDMPTMEEMLAQIAALDGKDSSEWQVAEARRLLWLARRGEADQGKLQEILDLLARAKTARPDFAPIYAVQAEVQLLQNKPDDAIESLRSALQKRPGEIAYLQRLSDVLMALNRVEEARPILAQLPEQQKRITDVIAEIQLLLRQDPEKALQRGQQIFPPTSDNVDVLMNLVEIYQAANKLNDAVPILQRATQLDPAQPRPWRVLVRALAGAGRRDEALAAIEQVKAHVPAESQGMTLGQCYATVGDYGMAEQAYAEAVQREPNNTILMRNQALLFLSTQQQEKLRATLNRLIAVNASDDRQSQADVAWGRRVLAQQMARDGSYQDFRDALVLLDKNAGDGGELTGDDLSLWLSLCANRPEADSRRMAVDRLNQIRNQRSLTSGENAVLAYVYHAEGRWPEAQRLMIDILSKNPDNASYLTTYIEWLLERQEFADAAVWIRKLDPNSTEAIRFSSILLTQQGKPQDAAKRLLSFVPQKIDEVEATRIMEELGKYNDGFFKLAQRQWKSLVAKNPQLIHSYIDFLTRMPKAAGVEEALQLAEQQLQQAVRDKRPELADYYLDLGMKALRANRKILPPNSPYFDRVNGWLELGRQAQLTDLQLIWHEVDLLDARRDYGKLMATYESLLKRTDISDLQRAVVRNNLAFVYAISNKGSQALAVIGDAINQLGPRSDFLDTRGLAYLADRQFENAVKDLRSAVSGGQGGAATYFHLALAEHSSGNIPEATAAIQQAQQLGLDEADLSTPEVALYRRLMRELEPHLKDNKLSQTK